MSVEPRQFEVAPGVVMVEVRPGVWRIPGNGWGPVTSGRGWPDTGTPACCYGAAGLGPEHCTCWEPVTPDQEPPAPLVEPAVRARRCHDCAFRPDSPERADGTLDDVLARTHRGDTRPFWCHQGSTPVTRYRHPSGMEVEIEAVGIPMDYQPERNAAGRPCRDDGTQQDVCAGWAAERDRANRTTGGAA